MRRLIAQFTFPIGAALGGWAAGVFDPGWITAVLAIFMMFFCFAQLFNPYLMRVEDRAWLEDLARASAKRNSGRLFWGAQTSVKPARSASIQMRAASPRSCRWNFVFFSKRERSFISADIPCHLQTAERSTFRNRFKSGSVRYLSAIAAATIFAMTERR